MTLIEIYRMTLVQIDEQLSRLREALEDNVPLELNTIAAQIPIFLKLHDEGAIILLRISTPAGLAVFEGGGRKAPLYLIEYYPVQGLETASLDEEPTSIRERLWALDDYKQQNARFLGDTSDGRTERFAEDNGFTSFGHGVITYYGKIIHFTPNERIIFDELLFNSGDAVELSVLCGAIGLNFRERRVEDAFSKIITPLNTKLKDILGYKPISSLTGRHKWILSFDYKRNPMNKVS